MKHSASLIAALSHETSQLYQKAGQYQMSLDLLLLLDDSCLLVILNILCGFSYQDFHLILFTLCVFQQYSASFI